MDLLGLSQPLFQQLRPGPSLVSFPQARFPALLTAGRGLRRSTIRCAGPAPYPPKTKFRKMHKGRIRGEVVERKSKLAFGTYGIKVMECGKLTYQTIEAVRRVLARRTKGKGKMWIRVTATYPITSKPLEVRMGSGKGNVSNYVARCKAGKILFELDGLAPEAAREALVQAGHKIGLKTKVIDKESEALEAKLAARAKEKSTRVKVATAAKVPAVEAETVPAPAPAPASA